MSYHIMSCYLNIVLVSYYYGSMSYHIILIRHVVVYILYTLIIREPGRSPGRVLALCIIHVRNYSMLSHIILILYDVISCSDML